MKQNNQKKLFVFQTIAFQLAMANSHYYKEYTFHRQSLFEQTARRFQILLTETFFNSVCPRVMKKYDKTFVVQVQAVFGTL